MTRPTIIMVAPNGARKVKTDHPAVPVTIDETIVTAKECHAAGASILHAHVRDDAGKHLLDVARYSKLLDGLRQEVPDMLVQITTEAVGIYTPGQQADLVFELKPDFVSVGFREMIGDNGEAARALARNFYHSSLAEQICVQHILYDIYDLVRFRAAMGDGILPDARPHVLLVLGRYSGNFQSDPTEMKPFIADGLPDIASWSICDFGHREFDVMTDAIANGGHCRVGFENNLYLKDGSLAQGNADLVRQLAETCQPASRAETLALFAL